jgi:hypothetical protein
LNGLRKWPVSLNYLPWAGVLSSGAAHFIRIACD